MLNAFFLFFFKVQLNTATNTGTIQVTSMLFNGVAKVTAVETATTDIAALT